MSNLSLREIQLGQGAVFADADNPSVSTVQFTSSEFPMLPAFEPHLDEGCAVHFKSPQTELTAARERCAIFDLPARSSVEITGADRASFLHNFCTNHIKGLQPGEGCEAFITSVKGRIVDHVLAFATEATIWLDSAVEHEAALLAHLDRYLITEDVQLKSRTADFREFFVTGPLAADTLSEWLNNAELPTQPGSHESYETPHAVTLRRVDWFGQPGYLVWFAAADRSQLWSSLTSSGAVPAGALVYHTLRIEAGWPIYGVDLTDENLAQEAARTSRAISFEKGCYLGQEPIARIRALGHVNRILRGVRLNAGWLPATGAVIVNAEHQEIGKLTSYAVSPADNRPVGLAFVKRKFATAGTPVFVQCNGENVTAEVFQPTTLD